ncbi:MAG: YbjN domain-containing protein [Armatimonadota bacterium]|nr:YbjN domain-containing protein [bacterium]MCS7310183.1 YbjN domain-containing protein [Armatimonadota bacterium]MDW8103981.1 YbjN domain-containing protein [Armatimonadota bacterium]MDW8289926.1 YbjN domain-containing protein [Armatimonadota bacterium]
MQPVTVRLGMWCVVAAVVFLVGVSVVSLRQAVNAQTDSWTYTGDNDEEAAKSLATFLKEHGMSAEYVEGGLVRLKVDDVNLALDPRPTENNLDRVCIHIGFGVKSQSKRSVGKLLEKVNDLNRRYNVGGFYLDKDNDLAFQTQITFVDTISYREIELAVRWAVRSAVISIMRHMEGDLS